MDDLQNRLAALENKHSGPRRCSMGKILASLPPETAEILERLLANKQVATRAIFQELVTDGYKIDRATVAHHRSGRCACIIEEKQ